MALIDLDACPFCASAPIYVDQCICCPDVQNRPATWTCSNAPYVGPGEQATLEPIWQAAVLGTDPGEQGGRWEHVGAVMGPAAIGWS